MRRLVRLYRALFVTHRTLTASSLLLWSSASSCAISTGFWLPWRLAYVADGRRAARLRVVAAQPARPRGHRRPQHRPPAGGRAVRGAHHRPQPQLAARRSGSRSKTRATCRATSRGASSRSRRRRSRDVPRRRSTIRRRGLYAVGPVEVTHRRPVRLLPPHARRSAARRTSSSTRAPSSCRTSTCRRRTCPARAASAAARTT